MSPDSIDRMLEEWHRSDPDLDPQVFHVIGRLLLSAELCRSAIAAALRRLDLSYGDFDVLNTLRRRGDPGGTNPRVLAESSLITTGAMTSRLDRLAEAGLVTRDPDPDDRRGVRVRLTRRGERLATRALEAVLVVDEEFLEPLSERDRAALKRILRQLLTHHESA